MKNFWARLGTTQQTQILVLGCAAIIGGYVFWFNSINTENINLEQKISRRANRLAARTVTVPQARSTIGTENQIKELQKKLDIDSRNLKRLLQRFAPIDDQEQRQILRRELSDLASGLGMRVIRLEGAQARTTQSNAVPDFNSTSDIDQYTGRPLIKFEAWGGDFALQTLLDDLDTLSYTMAPIRIQLTADEPKMSAQQGLEQQQILHINLVFAI